ncbi:MAG: pyrrolysine--tRNA(Pyl) ligase large subunit [Firmicutes bacterium]|nr:pyrrolysine--tRNA(Pyl) ligase large subunit [Bacillota bacterium]
MDRKDHADSKPAQPGGTPGLPANYPCGGVPVAIAWTETQYQRLIELNAGEEICRRSFASPAERDQAFLRLEKELRAAAREQLERLRREHRRPLLCRLSSRLTEALTGCGFVEVSTPLLLAKGLLEKMSITADHPLYKQIYWVERGRCLRPMLAPNLYYLLTNLLRLWEHPVRIFEIGSCFRKESQGAHHLGEFTMLNLVEMGLPMEQRQERLARYAALVMEAAGLEDYRLVAKGSEVYGETIDIVAEGVELGSAAMGPHPLDENWGITVPWVGIGFGLERMIQVAQKSGSISSCGRSLSYLDGVRLNI